MCLETQAIYAGLARDEIGDQPQRLDRRRAGRIDRHEGVRLALELSQRDLAARLGVGGGEFVRHVGRDIVVRGALDQQGRRQFCRHAAFEDGLRIGFRHRGFITEEGVVVFHQPLVAGCLRHPVARDGIGDRPAHHDVVEAGVDIAGASKFQGGVSGIARPQHVQQQLMAAARGAEPADLARRRRPIARCWFSASGCRD